MRRYAKLDEALHPVDYLKAQQTMNAFEELPSGNQAHLLSSTDFVNRMLVAFQGGRLNDAFQKLDEPTRNVIRNEWAQSGFECAM